MSHIQRSPALALFILLLSSCGSGDSSSSQKLSSLAQATQTDYTGIQIQLSEALDPTELQVAGNYTIEPEKPAGQKIISASIDSDNPKVVHLTTSVNLLPVEYVIHATNLKSKNGTALTDAGSAKFIGTGKVAFVTQQTGTANLTSWPNAGGATIGLVAADQICQSEATSAGLVGTFRAWISDSHTHAAYRIGSNTLGWIRTDGHVFTTSLLALLLESQAYVPLDRTADGTRVPPSDVWTNTDDRGIGNSSTSIWTSCGDWTDDTLGGNVMVGGSSRNVVLWASFYGSWCGNTSGRLYCLQSGDDGPISSLHTQVGKRVFVTSKKGTGDLSTWEDILPLPLPKPLGIAAGDAICQARAEAAGLPNSTKYKAWLSNSTTNAIDRITSDGPWIGMNGVLIANSVQELRSGNIFSGIHLNEFGDESSYSAWTGTGPDGTKLSDHCSSWNTDFSAFHGIHGFIREASAAWTHGYRLTCDYSFSLYCFENP